MGNFSINHYAAISVTPGRVTLLYIVDMAEIPTFQELAGLGAATPSSVSSRERRAYLSREARALSDGLAMTYAGHRVRLSVQGDDLIFPPGAGGLSTERIYLVFSGRLPGSRGTLSYVDSNFAGRAGWKEVVGRSAGRVRLQHASVSSIDRSNTLTIYPSSLTSSPPQDTSATFSLLPIATGTTARFPGPVGFIRKAERPLLNPDGSWSALARGLARSKTLSGAAGSSFAASRNDPLSGLMGGRDLSVGVLLVSLVVAFWFGAGHALSPGHGKTIVAAYLVGSRGTAAHAAFLGLTVTATHTAGVFALGLVTLYLSRYILPDQLYPVLGFISGMLVAVMGATLFARRLRAKLRGQNVKASTTAGSVPDNLPGGGPTRGALHADGHSHFQPVGMAVLAVGAPTQRAAVLVHPGRAHPHVHGAQGHNHATSGQLHRHGPFGVPHSHAPSARQSGEKVTVKSLLALGVSGGLLPCPSALVVLLSAIAFHRVAFGMLLIVAFSLGLATVLTGIGILVVYSGRLLGRLPFTGRVRAITPLAREASQILPILSASVVAVLGVLIAVGAMNPGILPSFIPKL
jgi:ABC-type nickel/cobalt efflux system permease component RcnA